MFLYEARRLQWPLDQTLSVMAGCVLGGALGAVLGSALFSGWAELPARVQALSWDGRTVVGGLGGGFVGVELAKKWVGFRGSTGPAFALAVPLGHALGRIGCLCAGCCFGTVTDVPWALHYPAGSVPHVVQMAQGLVTATSALPLPVHPAPIYDIAWSLGLLALLWRLRDWPWRVPGSSFRLYLLGFALGRVLLEFLRGDALQPESFPLKPVQVVLLAVVCRTGWALYRDEVRAARLASAPGSRK